MIFVIFYVLIYHDKLYLITLFAVKLVGTISTMYEDNLEVTDIWCMYHTYTPSSEVIQRSLG